MFQSCSKVRVLTLIACSVILLSLRTSNVTWFSNHKTFANQTYLDLGTHEMSISHPIVKRVKWNSVSANELKNVFVNKMLTKQKGFVNIELIPPEDKVDNLYLDTKVKSRFQQRRDHLTKLCQDPDFTKMDNKSRSLMVRTQDFAFKRIRWCRYKYISLALSIY